LRHSSVHRSCSNSLHVESLTNHCHHCPMCPPAVVLPRLLPAAGMLTVLHKPCQLSALPLHHLQPAGMAPMHVLLAAPCQLCQQSPNCLHWLNHCQQQTMKHSPPGCKSPNLTWQPPQQLPQAAALR
jgi:hypothetical protein